MRRLVSTALAAAVTLGCVLVLTGCRKEPEKYSATWFDVFDTVTVITGYAVSEAQWEKQSEALHADLLRYHQLFDIYNRYDGLTNLCDVNAQAAAGPVAVDDTLFDFLVFCDGVVVRTEGACNIAAGAVLRLWHDARYLDTPRPPEADALAAAAAHCDPDDLVLDEDANTVRFADPEMQLDVGAIGKGYAVELAAQAAEARGLTSALLNVGGNVRAIGTKPDGTRWTAGVENPWGSEPSYVAALTLEPGESVVISGDYQRYFEYEGVRYHHLIDLTTLQPARYVSSVAVLCTLGSDMADALSTGLFCLPVEKGLALVEKTNGVEALWLHTDGTMAASSGWENHLLD
ncbi:MAG: FAD:protein FMN transferase [Gemmiger sp.]